MKHSFLRLFKTHLSKTAIAYLQMPYIFLPVLPHFPHTRVRGYKFDLAIERSKVVLRSSFDLVDLKSRMLYTKSQTLIFFGSGEEDF